MSIRKMAEVWKFSRNGGTMLLVELAIADHVNDDGLAWPSIKYLANKTKLSERQVARVIKKLEGTGELEVIRGRRYHRYRINIPDKMSKVDKMSYVNEEITDIQGSIVDTQGSIVDIQGTSVDTAMSVKSLNNHKEIIIKTEAERIWEKCLEALKHSDPKIFDKISQFSNVEMLDNSLVIHASNPDYLNDHFSKFITNYLIGVAGRTINVKFDVLENG
jgi:DNA-binding transcriptional regulator YhcF (GntR family)